MTNGFTKTEQAILKLLGDGKAHPVKEMAEHLGDTLLTIDNLKVHVSNLRKELRPRGEDIVFTIHHRRQAYRLVRLLANPYDGVY